MKKTFEIEYNCASLVAANVRRALQARYKPFKFIVRELSAKQVDPMSGPIPIKTLALLDRLEELEKQKNTIHAALDAGRMVTVNSRKHK